MSKYIIVTGGGTGGHLSVAKSLIGEFVKLGYRVIYIGSTKGQDKAWFENDSQIEQTYFLDTYGVVNQKGLGKLQSLWKIFQGVLKCVKIFKNYNIEKVVSVGGFSAAAASFASILSRKKLYIHEQNAAMGKLNKITSKFAKELFSSYDAKSKVKEYPINEKFFHSKRLKEEIKTIIFLGGSQGAVAINNFAIQVAPLLKEHNINIIHQAGKNDCQRVKEEYEKLNIKADVFGFSNNLLEKIAKADFAVSRSGASTLWELCALATPALFIPYPYAAGNHQYYNAKFLEDQNMGFICNESELKEEVIEKVLQASIKEMSEKLSTSIFPNGSFEIAKIITKD